MNRITETTVRLLEIIDWQLCALMESNRVLVDDRQMSAVMESNCVLKKYRILFTFGEQLCATE